MVGLSAVSGCVVTDKIDFREPVNSPTVFPNDQPLAGGLMSGIRLGQIFYVIKEDQSWIFPFRIRDADIEQELRVHWRILRNTNPSDPNEVNERRFDEPIPVTGTDTREFSIRVNPGYVLFDNCHRVEIAVSGSFTPPVDGEEPGFLSRTDRADLAQFEFWLWEGDPSAPAAQKLVETCGAQLFEPALDPVAGGAAGTAGTAAEAAE